jgi:hypothetical protein
MQSGRRPATLEIARSRDQAGVSGRAGRWAEQPRVARPPAAPSNPVSRGGGMSPAADPVGLPGPPPRARQAGRRIDQAIDQPRERIEQGPSPPEPGQAGRGVQGAGPAASAPSLDPDHRRGSLRPRRQPGAGNHPGPPIAKTAPPHRGRWPRSHERPSRPIISIPFGDLPGPGVSASTGGVGGCVRCLTSAREGPRRWGATGPVGPGLAGPGMRFGESRPTPPDLGESIPGYHPRRGPVGPALADRPRLSHSSR